VDPGPRKVGRRRIGGEGSGCTAHLASKSPTKKKKKKKKKDRGKNKERKEKMREERELFPPLI
jgi:hypothetical protein